MQPTINHGQSPGTRAPGAYHRPGGRGAPSRRSRLANRRGAAVGSYRQAFEDRLEGTARALASAVKTEIGSYVVALSTLATARGLDPGGDLPSFHQRAQQVAAMLGTRIFVVTPDLSLLLHTHFPVGTSVPGASPRRGSVDVARQVFETGRPAVGNLLQGRVTGGRWRRSTCRSPVMDRSSMLSASRWNPNACLGCWPSRASARMVMPRSWTGKAGSWPAPRSLTGTSRKRSVTG